MDVAIMCLVFSLCLLSLAASIAAMQYGYNEGRREQAAIDARHLDERVSAAIQLRDHAWREQLAADSRPLDELIDAQARGWV